MKPPATFRQISRLMMDAWISGPVDAAELYAPFLDVLRPSMVLAVIDTRAEEPVNFGIEFIRRYRLPTTLETISLLQQTGPFSTLPDQDFVRSIMIPAYADAVESQNPATRCVVAEALGLTMIYDRIIFPQKKALGRSAWCVSLLGIRSVLPAPPSDITLDNIDLGIVQLLKEGAGARDIAAILRLSPRTVEHRIDKLKARFQARNITHLVTLSISAGMAGITRQDG